MAPPPWWQRKVRSPWSRSGVIAVSALAGVTLFLFRDAVLGRGFFYQRDVHLVWHPQIEGFVRVILAGSWPVWDPCQTFGQPLLADPGAQILYPLTWLNLVMRPWTYYTLFVVCHTFFSSLALFALGRRWGISAAGSLVAAVLWGASGPLLSMASLWHHFAGTAWIPVVFLAVHDTLSARPADRARTPWRIVVLAGALTGQILAGSADMCAMTMLAVAAYLIVEHRRLGVSLLNGGARLGSAYLCALGLTAALWWPALDVVSRSARAHLPESVRTYWSLHPLSLAELVLPASWTSLPLRAELRQQISESRESFLSSLYLGLPSLALAGAALLSRDRRRLGFLLVLSTVALVVALGRHGPFYDLAAALLPPLKILRYPVKAMVFVAFGWSLLAGLGFEVWRRAGAVSERSWRGFVMAPLLGVAVLAAAAVVITYVATDTAWLSLFDPRALSRLPSLRANLAQRFAFAASWAAFCLCLAVARLRQTFNPRFLALVAGLIAAGELVFYHRSLPLAPRDLYTTRPPVLDGILEVPGARVYSYDYNVARRDRPSLTSYRTLAHVPQGWTLEAATALAQQWSLASVTAGRWGVRSAFDIDWRGLYSEPLSLFTNMLRGLEGSPGHLRLLQIAGVTHVVALHDQGFEDLVLRGTYGGLYQRPVRLYRVPASLSRSYVVTGVRTADGVEAIQTLADPAFDPLGEVVLPEGQPRPKGLSPGGTSRIAEEKPDWLRIEATLAEPGYLVLLDTFDPGWRATVDGRPARLLRANVTFRGVFLPAGTHVVEFAYRPASLKRGILASLLAASVIVLTLLRSALRRP